MQGSHVASFPPQMRLPPEPQGLSHSLLHTHAHILNPSHTHICTQICLATTQILSPTHTCMYAQHTLHHSSHTCMHAGTHTHTHTLALHTLMIRRRDSHPLTRRVGEKKKDKGSSRRMPTPTPSLPHPPEVNPDTASPSSEPGGQPRGRERRAERWRAQGLWSRDLVHGG